MKDKEQIGLEDEIVESDSKYSELIISAKEFKSTPVRFIILAAIAIIGGLAGVIIYQNRNTNDVTKEKYDSMVSERNDWRSNSQMKDSVINFLQNEKYQFVLRLYEADQQKKVINAKIDSITTQVDKTNKILK